MFSVLVVEDDPDLMIRWHAALGEHGHEVLRCTRLVDAMSAIRDGGIDAIVMSTTDSENAVSDFVLQLEALPELPPMILVSAAPYAPSLSAQIGAAAFVPKPCSAAEIVAEVNRIFAAGSSVNIPLVI